MSVQKREVEDAAAAAANLKDDESEGLIEDAIGIILTINLFSTISPPAGYVIRCPLTTLLYIYLYEKKTRGT